MNDCRSLFFSYNAAPFFVVYIPFPSYVRRTPEQIIATELETLLKGGISSIIESSTKDRLHRDFPPAIQKMIEEVRIHVVGHDVEGKFLGGAILEKDLRHIHAIEKQLVLDPEKLEKEFQNFTKKLQESGGNPANLQASDFDFMRKGKHVSHLSVQDLLKLTTRKCGYALVAKYRGVPLAYNVGLPQVPIDDPDYSNLDVKTIVASKSHLEWVLEHYQEIWANWRTGVLAKFNDEFRSHLDEEKVEFPQELGEKEFSKGGVQRMGFSNIIKYAQAHAAKGWKRWIMFNIGRLHQAGHNPMDAASLPRQVSIPNLASMEAVGEAFDILPFFRNEIMKIFNRKNDHVADVQWFMHGNSVERVIEAMEREGGVLLRETKGWPLEPARQAGYVLQKKLRSVAEDKIEA